MGKNEVNLKKNENNNKKTMDLNEFSLENLKKIEKVLQIIIESYELKTFKDKEKQLLIPVEKFNRIGISFDESADIIEKIQEDEKGIIEYMAIKILEENLHNDFKISLLAKSYLNYHPVLVKDISRVKQLYKEVQEKIKEITPEKKMQKT